MDPETDNALAGGDDAALFNEMTTSTVADTAPEPVVTAPKAPAPVIPDAQPAQEREQTRVPLNELIEERRTRQALEKQLQALIGTMQANTPKPAPAASPEIWDDPTAFVQSQVSPILQRQHETIMYNAKMAAEARFGEDTVKAAEAEFNRLVAEGVMHPDEHRRINSSPNPFAEAVKWHKRQTVASEVGDDLSAYNAKHKAQLLNDPDFRKEMMAQLQQQAGGAAPSRSAPSINLPSLSRVGATAIPSGDGASASDADLWNSVTSQKKR